jgi:hypothetical protein
MPDGAVQGPQARSLTPEEAEARAQRCFEIDERIKAGLRAGREALWETARALHEFDEENGWTALGYEKIGEWLADPEVGMTRGTYIRLVGTFRELVVKRKLPFATVADLETSKVQIVLPKLKAGSVRLDEALDDVKALGQRDLREKYLRRPDPADLEPPDDPPLDSSMSRAEPDPPPNGAPTERPTWGDGRALGADPPDEEPPVIDGEVVEDDEEPVETEVVDDPPEEEPEAEPAHNDQPDASGQVQGVDPTGPSAAEVIDWIDRALPREASPAIRRHALQEARKFIVALFPELAELEKAAA